MVHPTEWMEVRQRVKQLVEDRVYPVERELDEGDRSQRNLIMAALMDAAKKAGLWALGHPREIGGQGMPFLDYLHVNEVIGRSFHAMQALGTLCRRLNERHAFGEPLANKQLMQGHVFESAAEIQACRQLTLQAALERHSA